MSVETIAPIIKELGFAGIALYALYVMNNLNTSLKSVEVTLARLCEKIN